MNVTIKRLPSGYYRFQGTGICQWAQVAYIPCSEEQLRAGNFQGGEEFIRSAMTAMHDCVEGKQELTEDSHERP